MKGKIYKQWYKKIKLSDWIAIVSIAVAGIALIKTYTPKSAKIEFEKLSEFTSATQWDTLIRPSCVIRLLLKNNGEKPVTIERLIKQKSGDGLWGYSRNGQKQNIDHNTVLKRIIKDLDSKFYIYNEQDSLQYINLDDGLFINKKVEPGENTQLNIIYIQTGKLDEAIESISFLATLLLSDNTQVPIHFDFDAKLEPRMR